VCESEVVSGSEPGCVTGISIGSTLFPDDPRGCVLGHTTILRLDRAYRRVNVVYTGLTAGCKLSIGDIKGTVVIDDDITHCNIILSAITYMKKSAGGLVDEHLCHKM